MLALVAEGRSNGAIAEQLFLSNKTVDSHISQIFMKLDLRESAGGPPPGAGGADVPAFGRLLASSSASSQVVTYSIRTIVPSSRKVVTWWYSSLSSSRPLPLPSAWWRSRVATQSPASTYSCGLSCNSSNVSSSPSQKRMMPLTPIAESERWWSGSTHSMSGSKSRVAASKSRRL